ncbi:MAG: TetR/AcrR family transcriptional regulator [Proteobacteria bacterium]|nr:TetR/AcrR family transcriptional regulator [Pseudomonadota bacterium]
MSDHIGKKRKRSKKETVERILKSGQKVFFSRSYVKATMDEIALEANISKPTLYQYFKTKDDLYFSLMLPVIEDIGKQLEAVEKKLEQGGYVSGAALIRDMFNGLYKSYQKAPESFRVFQLFHQTGLIKELDEKIRRNLQDKGKHDFDLSRRIMKTGMQQGLVKRINVHEFADMTWGLFVGIVQLEDMKSRDKSANQYLGRTLNLAVNFIINAIAIEREFVPILDGRLK